MSINYDWFGVCEQLLFDKLEEQTASTFTRLNAGVQAKHADDLSMNLQHIVSMQN